MLQTRTVRDRMKIIIVTSINEKKKNSKDDVHHSYQIGILWMNVYSQNI